MTDSKIIDIENTEKIKEHLLKDLTPKKATVNNGFLLKVNELKSSIDIVNAKLEKFKNDNATAFKDEILTRYEELHKVLTKDAILKSKNLCKKQDQSAQNKYDLAKKLFEDYPDNKWKSLVKGTNDYSSNVREKSSNLHSTNRGIYVREVHFTDINNANSAGKFFCFYTEESISKPNSNNNNSYYNRRIENHISNMVVGRVAINNNSDLYLTDSHVIIKDKVFQEFDMSKIPNKDVKLMYGAVNDFDTYYKIYKTNILSYNKDASFASIEEYDGESPFKDILRNLKTIQ